ncbi:hypothetical protein RFI_15951 [Reticulomyxa filosa]|uniref:Uncharacterized protein n=1 Tax=Reticulomyxa filosa TaxID=46433 RepID=X6N4N5_RETFI|nr:hypothetical protein RFI_15951 [Reticulomyxa filosa]|eukprot:ETO21255.1 hypothetical protein RFI_15951 [Reticulomyxa filosa]
MHICDAKSDVKKKIKNIPRYLISETIRSQLENKDDFFFQPKRLRTDVSFSSKGAKTKDGKNEENQKDAMMLTLETEEKIEQKEQAKKITEKSDAHDPSKMMLGVSNPVKMLDASTSKSIFQQQKESEYIRTSELENHAGNTNGPCPAPLCLDLLSEVYANDKNHLSESPLLETDIRPHKHQTLETTAETTVATTAETTTTTTTETTATTAATTSADTYFCNRFTLTVTALGCLACLLLVALVMQWNCSNPDTLSTVSSDTPPSQPLTPLGDDKTMTTVNSDQNATIQSNSTLDYAHLLHEFKELQVEYNALQMKTDQIKQAQFCSNII